MATSNIENLTQLFFLNDRDEVSKVKDFVLDSLRDCKFFQIYKASRYVSA